MGYPKKRSGDPDYDDKQPLSQGLRVVRAGDGTEVFLNDGQGPTTSTGAHYDFNAADPADNPGDNRPAPGDVAEETSSVQQYAPADVAVDELSMEEYQAQLKDGNGGVPGHVYGENDATVPATPRETPASKAGEVQTSDSTRTVSTKSEAPASKSEQPATKSNKTQK